MWEQLVLGIHNHLISQKNILTKFEMRVLEAVQDEQKKDTIEIDPTYLVYLHVLLASYYERTKELLGASSAEMLLLQASDDVVKEWNLEIGDNHLIDVLHMVEKRFGIQIKTEFKGKSDLNIKMKCPYASSVHGYMGSTNICPLSFMLLGIVRTKSASSAFSGCKLTHDGAKFEIKLQD